MDQPSRRRPPARLPARTILRRRLIAAALALLALVLVVRLASAAFGGDDSSKSAATATAARGGGSTGSKSTAAAAPKRPAPTQLPGGGRRIFPERRVVAFYGNPADEELGALGIGTPDQAGRKLARVAKSYARKTRPVLGAMELIVAVAAYAPGDDGKYRNRATEATIDRYLRAARKAHDLLLLDIQPGHATFPEEVRRLKKWLVQPDVGLALDPEWRLQAGQIPGKVIGSVSAAEVNSVSIDLAALVKERNLPEKLFVIHQFTDDMVRDKQAVKMRPGLATVFNVDGFGAPPNKIGKYKAFARTKPRGARNGFKLFFKEDTNRLSPSAVMRLLPRPDLIVYE